MQFNGKLLQYNLAFKELNIKIHLKLLEDNIASKGLNIKFKVRIIQNNLVTKGFTTQFTDAFTSKHEAISQCCAGVGSVSKSVDQR